ncbi:MAG: DUF58 domain-containing protein [Aggregatilineales bacterium]
MTRLFDETTLRKLDRLTLIASRVRAGVMKGERRSTRRGTSIEFADYREYAHGDDLRRIDWNVFARLDRPFIKLLEEEEDLAVHVLLDASGSMDWPRAGEPGGVSDTIHKFTFAQRVAAGLGHIALGGGDWLTLTALRGEGNLVWGPHRGRGRSLDLLRFLETTTATGAPELNIALRNYAVRSTRVGLCLLVSDMLSPNGYQDGLMALLGRGYEIAVIHLLSPDEVNPPLAGDLRLIDAETGQGQDVTVDAVMRDLYVQRLLAWRTEIGAFCAKRGIHYATVETDTPWEELILFELRRLGVVS